MEKNIKMETNHYSADATILWCFDHRNWNALHSFLEQNNIKNFDLISVAGGAKNLASPKNEIDQVYILNQIQTSLTLHDSKQIILMNHEDCGGYGGSKAFINEDEFEFHRKELIKAKNLVQEKFPSIPVKTIFLHFSGLVID